MRASKVQVKVWRQVKWAKTSVTFSLLSSFPTNGFTCSFVESKRSLVWHFQRHYIVCDPVAISIKSSASLLTQVTLGAYLTPYHYQSLLQSVSFSCLTLTFGGASSVDKWNSSRDQHGSITRIASLHKGLALHVFRLLPPYYHHAINRLKISVLNSMGRQPTFKLITAF